MMVDLRNFWRNKGRNVYDPYRSAIRFVAKTHECLGWGTTRIVFVDAHEVIKIPLHSRGESCNERELIPDEWLGSLERYAKTRRDFELSAMFGFLVIRMELVSTYDLADPLPAWTACVDCQQVGLTWDGRLVAYDWG